VAERLHLFFDFDDTLSDFRLLGAQYVENLAAILSSEMGGRPEHWRAAIPSSLEATVGRYLAAFQGNPLGGYNTWLESERARVVEDVFLRMGMDGPTGIAARELSVVLQERGLRRCNALYEHADEVLRGLAESGIPLYFASSQESRYLRAAMTGAPSYHHFREFYGPDLIDCAKEGPEYYRRVFGAVGIRPQQAIVIDDQPICLGWASEVGARVIQARTKENSEAPGFSYSFLRFKELPSLIEKAAAGTLTGER
jgi:FMN phosphatase YigB (HAD superfamily)